MGVELSSPTGHKMTRFAIPEGVHHDPESAADWLSGLRVSKVDFAMECIGISSATTTWIFETRKNFFRPSGWMTGIEPAHSAATTQRLDHLATSTIRKDPSFEGHVWSGKALKRIMTIWTEILPFF